MPIKTIARQIVIQSGPPAAAMQGTPEASAQAHADVLAHKVFEEAGETSQPTPIDFVLTDAAEIVELAGLMVGYDPTKPDNKAGKGAADTAVAAKIAAMRAE